MKPSFFFTILVFISIACGISCSEKQYNALVKTAQQGIPQLADTYVVDTRGCDEQCFQEYQRAADRWIKAMNCPGKEIRLWHFNCAPLDHVARSFEQIVGATLPTPGAVPGCIVQKGLPPGWGGMASREWHYIVLDEDLMNKQETKNLTDDELAQLKDKVRVHEMGHVFSGGVNHVPEELRTVLSRTNLRLARNCISKLELAQLRNARECNDIKPECDYLEGLAPASQ